MVYESFYWLKNKKDLYDDFWKIFLGGIIFEQVELVLQGGKVGEGFIFSWDIEYLREVFSFFICEGSFGIRFDILGILCEF